MCGSDIFLALLALLFPPVAVWVKRGVCSADSLINLALCCLGLLPGLLHAWYIIWAYPNRDEYERVADAEENGNVTYYYVAHTGGNTGHRAPPSRGARQQHQQQPYRSHPAGPNYGAVPNQQFPGQQTGLENPWADEGRSAAKVGSSAPPPPPSRGQAGDSGEGSASHPPPTYAEAVRGDHKIQTHD